MTDSSIDSSQKKQLISGEEIWVNEFTEKSAQKFREQIFAVARRGSTAPIVIYIDSYGGYVDSLAKMIASMDELPNPKITVCMGKAMSCGAILLSHGDFRFCDKHSRIMIHEVSHGSWGTVHDVYSDASEGKRMNTHFLGLLADNCGIKNGYKGLRQIIKENDGKDIYLDAKAAVNFGIVEKVGTPEVVPIVQYQIAPRESKRYVLDGGRGTQLKDKTITKTRKKKTRKKKKTTKKKKK